MRIIQVVGQALLHQSLAAGAAAGFVEYFSPASVNVENVDVGIAKAIVDQADHLIEQIVFIQDGGDGSADFCNRGELFGAAAQPAVKLGAFEGDGYIASQGTQNQHIRFLKIVYQIALHVQHAQHLAFDFER